MSDIFYSNRIGIFRESGINDWLHIRVLNPDNKLELDQLSKQDKQNFSTLKLVQIFGAFTLLMIMNCTSFVIVLLEYLYSSIIM